jgi:hypothetical protein
VQFTRFSFDGEVKIMQMEGFMPKTFEDCYHFADLRSDAGDQEAADVANFGAATAENYRRKLVKLAWACVQKSSAKRHEALQIVLAELDAAGESLGEFPSRARL